jgi:hypothetical protein
MRGAITLLPLYAFMVWTGKTSPFPTHYASFINIHVSLYSCIVPLYINVYVYIKEYFNVNFKYVLVLSKTNNYVHQLVNINIYTRFPMCVLSEACGLMRCCAVGSSQLVKDDSEQPLSPMSKGLLGPLHPGRWD